MSREDDLERMLKKAWCRQMEYRDGVKALREKLQTSIQQAAEWKDDEALRLYHNCLMLVDRYLPKPTVRIRPLCGGFAESMEQAMEVSTGREIIDYLKDRHPFSFFNADITFVPYGGIDNRNGWDTHLVLVNNQPMLFSDGIV